MELAHLIIRYETESGSDKNPFQGAKELKVMFNPSQLVQTRRVTWTEVPGRDDDPPSLTYASTPTDGLSIDLFFDTSEESDGSKKDVRSWTSQVYKLTMLLPKKHRPPLCQLIWGSQKPFFQGVLDSADPTYKYFLPDGTAVRAKVTCHFKGWDMQLDQQGKEKQSTDVEKSHLVRRGDTLASIAHRQLHSAALWRVIARANKITDPLSIAPGQRLRIPTHRES
jgi:Contractile injection system tube protein/LysM domain